MAVRAAIAVLLAGLLMWTQAVIAAFPVVHVESAVCCCCDCGKRDCCGSQAPTSANPQSPSTAAVRLTAQEQAKLPKPGITEQRPVFVSPVRKNFLSPVAQRAPALPLFQRHCVLLI